MPKISDYPRFREKTYKLRGGTEATYYVWDGRCRGVPDVRLGKDRAAALELWKQCEQGLFDSVRPSGPLLKKVPKVKRPGKRRRIGGPEWTNAPPWSRTMYFNAERRAQSAGKSFTLTPQQFLQLVFDAKGRCSMTGIPFDTPGSRKPFAPSIDRIDSSKGYEPGNVRLVCLILNFAMGAWGLTPVLQLARAVLDAPIHATTDAPTLQTS